MKWLGVLLLCIVALPAGWVGAYAWWINPGVARELRESPDGERARKVMLLELPSGRELPVNYLREGDTVYAAADGRWWRELRGEAGRGSVWIRGDRLHGRMFAVEDDPELRDSVFERLRPTAPRWAGILVVIELDRAEEGP
jgi:hypothetical protein